MPTTKPPRSPLSRVTSDQSAVSDNGIRSLSDPTAAREPTDLVTTFRVRLHAANLARRGVWKNKLPDSYARIVTTSGSSSSNGNTATEAPSSMNSLMSEDFSSGDLSVSNGARKLGETEVIRQNRNPQWTETVLVDYEYGSVFHFTVHVLQPKGTNGVRNLGSALFEMGDILGTRHATKVKRLRNGGCVFCHLEPVHASNVLRKVYLQFAARDLKPVPGLLRRGNLFHRDPDTVLELAKQSDEQAWVTVYRSQPVLNSSNPDWDAVELNLGTLCNGDLNKRLRISIKSVKQGHSDELIGMTESTLSHLLMSVNQDSSSAMVLSDNSADTGGERSQESAGHEMLLQRSIQRSLSEMFECGRLKIKRAEMQSSDGSESNGDFSSERIDAQVVEVVDISSLQPVAAPIASRFDGFMNGDCQIDFCVAVDFTSSNGDPRTEDSLHYQCSDSLNDYEETITAIGEALDVYSKSKDYPVWGFGAKFGGQVRHVFQCGATSTVAGVEGILTAYKSIFHNDLIMSGPTDFRSVIQASAVRARKHHLSATESGGVGYTVLLVITDGVMDNFQETQQKLASYSGMPLSIVFVGVGRSDFGPMYQLCETSSSQQRCTTTFVDFRQHQSDPAALGEAALQKIPAQLCEYMDTRGFH